MNYRRTLIALQFQRSMLCPVLADMCTKGMRLDDELVRSLYDESVSKRQELSEKLYTLTNGVNLSSNKQLGEYLYEVLGFEITELTAKGAPSTSIGTISSLVPHNDKQKEFLELYLSFNKVDQLLTKYLTLFHAIVEENDGLLFGDINQGTTATHRFSSSGVPFKGDAFKKERSVQFQNIPRGLKKVFVPKRKGWLIGEVDGSQLEFRVAACIAQDPVALKEINDLVDIHAVTAEFFGCSRQDAKAHCVPMHAEILTQNGWKTYYDLLDSDVVAQYDQASDSIVWGRLLGKVKFDSAPVIRAQTKHNWQVECTPNHRWYGWRRAEVAGGKRVAKNCEFTFENCTTEHRVTVSAKATFDARNTCSDDLAAFVGWAVTDGHTKFSKLTKQRSQGSDGRRRLHTCVLIQKKYVSEIRDLLDRLQADYVEECCEGGIHRWRIPSATARKLFTDACITPEEIDGDMIPWVLSLSTSAREAFFTACKLAEGTRRKNGEWRVSQNVGHVNDAITLAGYLCGHDVRVVLREKDKHPRANYDHAITTFRRKSHITCMRMTFDNLGNKEVWCPRTEHGSWVMRQGDVITITGNTFQPLYGGNGSTKKEKDYAKFFRKKYSAIAKLQQSWCHDVIASPDRKLVLPYGMVYNFPDTKMQADGYITGTTNIYNYPIQGLATAEIIPVSLAYMWHNLPDGIEIINTIHDSIICEVREDMQDEWLKLCIQSMTFAVYDFFERVYGYEIKVPLGLGAKLGERWGSGDERTFQVEDGQVVEIVKVNGVKEKHPWNG